jgi:hypothetical protein
MPFPKKAMSSIGGWQCIKRDPNPQHAMLDMAFKTEKPAKKMLISKSLFLFFETQFFVDFFWFFGVE